LSKGVVVETGGTGGGVLRSREVAKLLSAMLLTSLVAACIAFVTGWLFHDTYAVKASLFGVVMLPVLAWLLSRGFFTSATVGFLIVLNAIAVFLLCTGGGLHDPGTILFAMVIVASGLLMNRAMALFSACLSLCCVSAVGVAELTGALQTQFSHLTNVNDLINILTVLGLTAVSVQVLTHAFFLNIERIQQTEQSYLQIFNATGEGIVLIDRNTGSFQDVNNALLEMLEISRSDLLDRSLGALTGTGETYDEVRLRAYFQAAADGNPQVFEWAARRSDGADLWLEISMRIAIVQGGQRILAVMRNVTDRRAEQQRIQVADKLQAVGQLAQGVAHDFNNQLTVILANASLLAQKLPVDSPLATYTEAIVESSRRSAALTQQLFAFARKGRRQSAPVDINALCNNVCELLRRSIDKRIEIQCQISTMPAFIEGDDAFVQNALLNLGLNARDAMPTGGTLSYAVSVVESETPGKKLVRILVTDTGIGIDPAHRARIFEPFFTTKETGHGMGLAAVYGTVKAHDGTIDVDSALGVGTTFVLVLPAMTKTVNAARTVSYTGGSTLDGTRVLLAEDEPGVAEVVVATLQILGCTVTHCKDGAEALAELDKNPESFDVVILDESMPKLTGTEVLIQMRLRNLHVPVISTSGHAKVGPGEGDTRADLFLPKPFSIDQLSESLSKALEKAQRPPKSATRVV
jgi:PAS domain S-box-containing protein